LFAFDINGLLGGSLADPSFSYRGLGLFLSAYGKLGVDLIVMGFSDHIVELPPLCYLGLHEGQGVAG
jgi:hypothetical protein